MPETARHYTVLARRFRPQAFDDVVGQEHVARSLRNAIAAGRVAHAYLFTGARGVGKTSTARILAKALNCPNVADGIPCNECDVCEAIAAGHDVDVIEIDGASNRRIDDIRMIRQNVSVKSMRSRFKVYIIDEVHMLTTEAFNALLKTLEEPPPNVKFVFCTTEPNKVPDTILSRCQRFDFSTISTGRIGDRLTEIAEAEGRTVEPAAVDLVARRAAGSMRDSQSLFDQLLAFGGETITAEDVHRLLGTASDDRLLDVVGGLRNRRPDEVLAHLDAALEAGVQLDELLNQIIGAFRDLMIVATGADGVPLGSVAEDRRDDLREHASEWGLETILAGMQVLAETKSHADRSVFGRALVELALVRIASMEDMASVAKLIGTLRSGGEVKVAGGNGSREAPSRSPSAAAPPRSRDSARRDAAPPAGRASNGAATNATPPAPAEAATATPSPKRVPFEAGREADFLAELLSHVDDAAKMHLGMLHGSAISGPNRLELSFPTSYHFGKQFCEQSEVQSRLNEVASQIAGQPVGVTFRLVAVETDSEPEPAQESRRSVDRPPERAGDLFAAHVQNVFEATIVKVDDAPATPSSEEG